MAKLLASLVFLSSFASAAPHRNNRAHRNKAPSGNGCVAETVQNDVGKAIYFLSNEAQNAVVALPIDNTGLVSRGTTTVTGGAGSNFINSADNTTSAPDALVGQSALTIVGNNLFAVNAGSNTLTMMAISPNDPTSLTMVGQPINVLGEFPTTVSASLKNQLVCVGTTGAMAGISCARFSEQGLSEMDCLRPFDIGQTTPPRGPLNSVSQTFFSADESVLFTTVKGDPAVNNTGFLSSFAVEQGNNGAAQVSEVESRSSPAGTAVLFGSVALPGNPSTIFATDASFGAAVLSVDQNGQASTVRAQPIDGQAATCWATVSDNTKSAFVTDVGVNRVVEMSLEDASIVGELNLTNGDPGLIDLRAAGNFVYALSPGNGTIEAAITVLDISGGQGSMKQAQHFELSGIASKNAQGMAVLL
ncbi:hypothetical protein BU24DRAFT_441259 [Aaosphaeria arxii CBS 175.79]|uniref:3-carboxymuconate cyclase n=1 Tax=Aaosphaeria arxii CBS 175.79 TaxID=1450172 RepID=A0A6A5XRY4_9PLEO|nr:uncharacterized protein BU24DRAFT_441259 [Aaosphaeria arxii CBS 175.79]KAF2015669.1 hypothetical protein BU24DRAFT_441259 [Aaosphaeria arxii CBS 175.79]